MKQAIVAIGGGLIRTHGTAGIDREIIRLCNRRHPRVLFIPTASGDAESYQRRFVEHFGGFLGCKADVLRLVSESPSLPQIKSKIFSADAIYVGGGNTLSMMRLWRRLGVDRMLRSAYERGIILSGISAGAICWFDSGHSDSMSFYRPEGWKYVNVRGLGLIKAIHCPHYNSRTLGVSRRKDFREMMGRIGGLGIGLENNCALEVIDGRFYRVIVSKPDACAYRLRKDGGVVRAEPIPQVEELTPIGRLGG